MTDMARTCKIYDAERSGEDAALGVWRGLKTFAEQKEFFQSIGVLYISESTTVDEITANLNNFDSELSVKKLKELFNTSQIVKQYKAVYNELVFKAEREQ